MKRIGDIALASGLLALTLPASALAAVLVRLDSEGPVLHVSQRVGRDNRLFRMFKFRTMRVDTPALPTHLLTDPDEYLTGVGRFLRRTSLDELPQLLNVIKGEMAMIGPRPALFNQEDLVAMRTRLQIHRLRPGITGWAQTHGRDEIPLETKVELDAYHLTHKGWRTDVQVLWLTLANVLGGKDVSH